MKFVSQDASVHLNIDPAVVERHPAAEPLIGWRAAQMKARLERLRLVATNGIGALPPPRSARRAYNQADLQLAARAFAKLKTVPAYDGPRLAIESDLQLEERRMNITVNRLMSQLEA